MATITVTVKIGDIEEQHIIDEVLVKYSPYMSSCLSMTRTQRGNDDGYNEVTIEHENRETVLNYLSFIKGSDSFTMTEEDEVFFDYMGHHNHNQYPLDYWRLKLRSKWIRDMFYVRELWRDPLYGLIEVTPSAIYRIVGYNLDTERDGVVLAGGAVLSMMGIGKTKDLDLFSLDKEKSIATIFNLARPNTVNDNPYKEGTIEHKNADIRNTGKYRIKFSINAINIKDAVDLVSLVDNKVVEGSYINISLIRRVYRSPAEVVHGFDLDASQFVAIYYGDSGNGNRSGGVKVYATELGIYAMMNMVNWVDPEMASTTYLQRLAKYQRKGFKMRLPLLDRTKILKNWTSPPNSGDSGTNIPSLDKIRSVFTTIVTNVVRDPHGDGYGKYRHYRITNTRDRIRDMNIPHDLGSIMIYIDLMNITCTKLVYTLLTQDKYKDIKDIKSVWKKYSDAIAKQQEIEDNMSPEELMTVAVETFTKNMDEPWIEVDPMSQGALSGIMYPLTYCSGDNGGETMHHIYSQSPFYQW